MLRFLLALILIAAVLPTQETQAAPVRGSAHGLTSDQLRQLRQLPVRAILPGKLPVGYVLKQVQVQTGPQAGYQLDYRCFCGSMNFTISILGTHKPLSAGKGKLETVQASRLGTKLQLGLYPAGQGFKQAFYMSSWLGKTPLKIGVISALQGHSAPKADLLIFVQNLEYLP